MVREQLFYSLGFATQPTVEYCMYVHSAVHMSTAKITQITVEGRIGWWHTGWWGDAEEGLRCQLWAHLLYK